MSQNTLEVEVVIDFPANKHLATAAIEAQRDAAARLTDIAILEDLVLIGAPTLIDSEFAYRLPDGSLHLVHPGLTREDEAELAEAAGVGEPNVLVAVFQHEALRVRTFENQLRRAA